MKLLGAKDAWRRAPAEADLAPDPLRASMEEHAQSVPRYTHEHIRVVGPAIARWIEVLADSEGSGREHPLASALTGLLDEMGSIEVDIWYEEETVRIRSQIRFDAD